MTAIETTTGVAERFLDALARRDYEALAACLAPESRLRALVPAAVREEEGPQAIAARYQVWLEGAGFEVLAAAADECLDLVRLRYTVRALDPESGQPTAFEQTAYARVAEDRITRIDLVCTGNRPLP